PKYSHRVYPNATMLLRPKTGLKDMVVELNPGTRAAGPAVKDGYTVPVSNTLPDVNLDEFLSVLDGDTRTYLDLLLNGGAEGLSNDGTTLAQVFRRFEPTARDTAQITKLLGQRRQYIQRSIHNFGVFANALAARDQQLGTFVENSNTVFRHFANQDVNLQRTIQLLPAALRDTNAALAQAKAFADQAGPAPCGPERARSAPRSSSRGRSSERRRRSSRTSCGRSRGSRRRSSSSCARR